MGNRAAIFAHFEAKNSSLSLYGRDVYTEIRVKMGEKPIISARVLFTE